MLRNVSMEEAMDLGNPLFVDVRSLGEYLEDTIPGAINVPLLDDEERALIGSIYHQKGPEAARRTGLEVVSPKLPQLVEQIAEAGGDRQVVVFCWRGGLRSQAVARVLELVGLPIYWLTGGYKSFRRYINSFFEIGLRQTVVVIYGLTGVGKTEIIYELQRMEQPVLDLEGLANHRGSVFGAVGLGEQPSQKRFESLLWWEIRRWHESSVLIVEGESRKIGRLFLPVSLYSAMLGGRHVLVFDSMENRVRRIVDEYAAGPGDNRHALEQSIGALTIRIGKQKAVLLQSLTGEGKYDEVVPVLLREYYDPLYRHPDIPSPAYDLCVNNSNPAEAAKEIAGYVEGLHG
ncbi:MAG: tRNA 2-selenouridine(34) synthase MnmH [Bacillota bacterium]